MVYRPPRTTYVLRRRIQPVDFEPPPLSQEAIDAARNTDDLPKKDGDPDDLDALFGRDTRRAMWRDWYDELGDVETARLNYRFAQEKPLGVAILVGRRRRLNGRGDHSALFRFVPDLRIEQGEELRLLRSHAILRFTLFSVEMKVELFPVDDFGKALVRPAFVMDITRVSGDNPFPHLGGKMRRYFCMPERGTDDWFAFMEKDAEWDASV